MTRQRPNLDDASLPALLRAARGTYAKATAAALAEAGCDDVPRNGPYVISAIMRIGPQLGLIIRDLRVSKQAAGQLVDTLVLRGYLERAIDPEDRRRFTVSLSERGRVAAAAIRSAVVSVDTELAKRLGAENIKRTKQTLYALAHLLADPTIDD